VKLKTELDKIEFIFYRILGTKGCLTCKNYYDEKSTCNKKEFKCWLIYLMAESKLKGKTEFFVGSKCPRWK